LSEIVDACLGIDDGGWSLAQESFAADHVEIIVILGLGQRTILQNVRGYSEFRDAGHGVEVERSAAIGAQRGQRLAEDAVGPLEVVAVDVVIT